MFTVKHTSSKYADNLYTAREVRFEPRSLPPNSTEYGPETVWISGPELPSTPITDGVVYVMNDAGATVSKYDLDACRRGPDPVG